MNLNKLNNLKSKIVADLELLAQEHGTPYGDEIMNKILKMAEELESIQLDDGI